MSKSFQYRSGSLIYFQGDEADKVYLLQDGKVSLVYQEIETGEDVRDQLQPGEFFGVRSALGHFPREENAITLSDTTILTFSVPEFEALAMANTRIIMKMLKVFSTKLRRIHTRVSSLLQKEDVKPDEGLFNLGEYYLKNKRFSHAKYMFSSYLAYYPSGNNAAQAAKNLETAEIALAKGDDSAAGGRASPQSTASETAAPKKEQSEAAKAYYDAVSLVSQEKYQQAYLTFKKIIDGEEESEWKARSSYELGRCLFLLKKYDDCIQHFTGMFTHYPKHPEMKAAVFLLGQCYEKNNKKGQAAAFYNKVISLAGGDDKDRDVEKAKQALEALEA